MKTILNKLISTLLLILLIGTSACSDDEKNEVSPTEENNIVGIWLEDGDTNAYQFKADGTGVHYLHELSYMYVEDIEWTYNGNILTIYGKDEDGEKYSYHFRIMELTEQRWIGLEDGGSLYTFIKQPNLSFLSDWE